MNQDVTYPRKSPTTHVRCLFSGSKKNLNELMHCNAKRDVRSISRSKFACGAEGKENDLASKAEGRSTYRPSSYTELIDDAVGSIVFGIQDKLNRMEVEFPSVSNVDGYKGSSDLYIDSNIQLAISAGRKIFSTTAMKVHILLPDEAEYKRAYRLYV